MTLLAAPKNCCWARRHK